MHLALRDVQSFSTKYILGNICSHIRAKDEQTYHHCVQVEKYASALAKEVSCDHAFVSRVRIAALVHDVGKIYLPLQLVHKKGKLSDEEISCIRNHPEMGFEYLKAFPALDAVSDIVLMHHEWWNGQGYPLQKEEKNIPVEARIISIADAFDAMTGIRSYRLPMQRSEAKEELLRCRGNQFDPALIDIFINIV